MAKQRMIRPLGGEQPPWYKDLVDQLNRALTERDSKIAAMEADPVMFAFAQGRTNGVGGVATIFSVGGALEVQGNNVALRFSNRRSSDQYVFMGLMLETSARFAVGPGTASKTRDVCIARFYQDNGTIVPANATVYNFQLWAIGPRS